MKELKTLVEEPNTRKLVVSDCVNLVEDEVKGKKGISGFAVKTAFKVVKAIRPTILRDIVESLADDFVEVLQPVYNEYVDGGSNGTLETYFRGKSGEVANCLLTITDQRAERSTNKTLVKGYKKLRPSGMEHVAEAAPGIGRVLDKHLS